MFDAVFAILFFGIVLSGLLVAMCLMIGKLLFDMSGNDHERSNKRYRGNVKHWTEIEENNR